jgi:hypothetical protein
MKNCRFFEVLEITQDEKVSLVLIFIFIFIFSTEPKSTILWFWNIWKIKSEPTIL